MMEPSDGLDTVDWIHDCVRQCERRIGNLQRDAYFRDATRRVVTYYCLDVICLCEALKIVVQGLQGIEDHSVSGDPVVARQLLSAAKQKMLCKIVEGSEFEGGG